MSKILQNTGAKVYVGKLTYNQLVLLNQKIAVRDEDSPALLAVTTKDAAGAAVNVFTLSSGTADVDVTAIYPTKITPTVSVGSSTTVASLPPASASYKGYRGFVVDATVAYTSANIGSTVVGGGANTVPVFCTGANWVVG